jgi:DNA-directed RNA polymerase subunit E"
MSKEKACKNCKTIHSLAKCPNCNSEEFSEGFKGKVVILNPDESEIAKKLKLTQKGTYAIKL